MKICPKCKTEHEKSGTFCSRNCANSRGPRTDKFKKLVSEKLTGRSLSAKHIENISGDNHHQRRGKNLPPLEKECLNCGKLHKARKFCSQSCYTEFNKAIKTEWQNYATECKFKFDVYEYPNWFDLSLIEQYGWYRASNRGNNLNGVSRDHRYSVKEGFLNKIDPKLISHPANCQLMPHIENQTKWSRCSITIERLLEDIERFNVLLAE